MPGQGGGSTEAFSRTRRRVWKVANRASIAAINRSFHAAIRAQQRCIPLVEQWLDQFGEEKHDGHGGVLRYFSRASIRALERAFGRAPVRKMTGYLDAYKVEKPRRGDVLTIGHRTKRIKRKCRRYSNLNSYEKPIRD